MADERKNDECQHYEHYVSREDRYICPKKEPCACDCHKTLKGGWACGLCYKNHT